MKKMYPAVINSPPTMILGAVGVADTTITVLDDSNIPDAPNLLVIGGNSVQSETVLMTAKNGTELTVERGFQGTARSWNATTIIARNFTAYDYDAHTANIKENSDNITAERERAVLAEQQSIQTAETYTDSAVNTEVNIRQQADAALQSKIDAADANIKKNSDNITAEIGRATQAEQQAIQTAKTYADSKAPTSHESKTTVYGAASEPNYGHVRLSNTDGTTASTPSSTLVSNEYALRFHQRTSSSVQVADVDSNFNDYRTPGEWYFYKALSTSLNHPPFTTGSGSGLYLKVMQGYSNTSCIQMCWRRASSETWIRHSTSATAWSNWALLGSKGDTGPTGKSAFESAKSGGYSGSETQFNSDLAAVQGLAAAILAITGV